MTGRSPRKRVDALYWQGRLAAARAYAESARQSMLLVEPGQLVNPIVSQIVLSAIAYGDSLTAKRARVINQQDHAAAPRLLRDALRDTLPDAEERRYRRILGFKDEAQYGARAVRLEEAVRLMSDLESFARWAEDHLQPPPTHHDTPT
jgi:hypothetical protein